MLVRSSQWVGSRAARLGLVRTLDCARIEGPGYLLLGGGFVLLYVAVERSTLVYQLDGLGITLWGPSAGMSLLLLLTKGLSFAPFVFVASLISDFAIYSGPRGVVAPVATSLIMATGLPALALALRRPWRSFPQPRLADVVAMLVIVPFATLLIALLYCSILYATGLLSPWRFVLAVRNFWIGDTVGMITLVPAAPALASILGAFRSVSRSQVADVTIFTVGVCAALWVIFGLRSADEYQFFYLLFLPTIWIAIRAGYAGASIGLLFAHILLVVVAIALGYAAYDFIAFQMLMLVLSATGLLLGAAVTEGRLSEDRNRKQQAELARATRHATVGAMGTALAHEISQPISSATSYLHAAVRMLRSSGDEHGTIGQALAKAEIEAQRARETLERVRDYVSSGRVDVTQVDLGALVAKIVALIRRDANARGVNIEASSAPGLPRISADIGQIEQLLLNLISNAVDSASQRVGKTGQVHIRLMRRADRLVVQVEDNGVGVAAEMADRLFEPFETTKLKGMGLGLTVVQQIVDAHGGQLAWENLRPQGARFTAELRIDGPRQHDT